MLKSKGSAKIKSDPKPKVTPKSTPSTPKQTPSTPKQATNKINPRKASVEKVTPIVNPSEPITTTTAAISDEPVISRSGRKIKPKR